MELRLWLEQEQLRLGVAVYFFYFFLDRKLMGPEDRCRQLPLSSPMRSYQASTCNHTTSQVLTVLVDDVSWHGPPSRCSASVFANLRDSHMRV
jgi:hypothetical protein